MAIAEASGSYVTDVDGRVYIDFLAGAGVLAVGRNHLLWSLRCRISSRA